MVLYERLDVFVKHVVRYSMNDRSAGIDCKTLVSMMDMMQGLGGGDKVFDHLGQRMGQSCSVDLCAILK